MLNDNLIDTLIIKNLLGIYSQIQIKNELDNFSVKSIAKTSKGYMFTLVSNENYKETKVKSAAIVTIDGMDPKNLAAAFDIAPNGGKVQLGKRRGRPLKVRSEEYWAKLAEKKAKTKKKIKIGRK